MATADIHCSLDQVQSIAHADGSAVSAYTIMVVNNIVAVALADLDASEEGEYAIHVPRMTAPKLSTDVVTAGDILYWDDGNSRMTLTASTHEPAGIAVEDAGNGDTTVLMALDHRYAHMTIA